MQLLTTSEAAQKLKLNPRTLDNARYTGVLCGKPAPKYMKLGGKTVRYREEALQEWLDQFREIRQETN